MKQSMIQAIHDQYRETQSLILHVVSDLTPDQWQTRSTTVSEPIAHHVWHVAREADILQLLIAQSLGKPVQQIWERDSLAARWDFPIDALGLMQSGIGMDEADAALIPWPSHDELVNYLQQAFGAANDAISALDGETSQIVFTTSASAVFGGAGTVERAIMRAIANGNRHLGIIGWISTSTGPAQAVRQTLHSRDSQRRHRASAGSIIADM